MIEKFVRNAEGAGFHVHRGEPREIADAGSSWAPYGLADTGSSVLAASPEEPRASSLLPAVHVSLLSEDRGSCRVFAAVGDDLSSALAIRYLAPAAAPTSSSCSPSASTAPGEVHVVLLPRPSPGAEAGSDVSDDR